MKYKVISKINFLELTMELFSLAHVAILQLKHYTTFSAFLTVIGLTKVRS
jgi:hypothetical protein